MLYDKLNKQRGITYTSVLIASLIISIINISLFNIITNTKDANIISKDKIFAKSIAESEIEKSVYKIKSQNLYPDHSEEIDKFLVTVVSEEIQNNLFKVMVAVEYTSTLSRNREISNAIVIERLVILK